MGENVTVRTSAGLLRGVRDEGVDRYLGIPYAAAPVGPLRFAAPEPAPGWAGERNATAMGATAPQPPYGPAVAHLLANVIIPGDEYLTVNVWAPADSHDRPVMVWVHGGSLVNGSNAVDVYDGTAFARDGVVLVSVNYRLGAEGFSVLGDAPVNLGLADVAAALRWVRTEITAFGGDPANVTAFGESAGATVLAALLAAGASGAGLFDRVILQSGPPTAASPREAGRITRRIAARLGVAASRDAFRAVPPSRLVEAQAAITAASTPLTGGPGYAIATGDALVSAVPFDALLAGAGAGVPVLLGWTAEEYRLWLVPSDLLDRVSPALFAAARLRFGIGPRVLGAYRAAHPGANRGELFGLLATDLILRLPYHRIADARVRHGGAPTFVYEFAWRSPVEKLGAAHAMELGFVFDRLRSPGSISMAGPDAPQRLADRIHAAWVRFATNGDPGWRAWDPARPVMVFDDPVSTVADAPRDAELAAWRRRTG